MGIAYQDLPCDKPPPPPPLPKKLIAKAPAPAPAEKAEEPRGTTRTTVRIATRRAGKRPPEQRFIGQTAPTPAPPPVHEDKPPESVAQAENLWGLSPEEIAALLEDRGNQCQGPCHARHPNFRKDAKRRLAAGKNGQSLSTGSGSGGGASQPKPAAQPTPKPAAQPAPKTTTKTTTTTKTDDAAAGEWRWGKCERTGSQRECSKGYATGAK
ncbi:hypothetical protein [Polyangium jinanense]|uniref:Uncharacterized protein n=1 Tax=Polyangium jinanense TaxID=2829994 RepID=A0A9X3X7Y7_9BACT|nr:hypothetical protein [Polyangium jinanense]MDC3961310.1 hypothetical protein [Polyangium jinanense]MDC3984058.1 hypothetical protein [Polyangium jinanense]